MKRAQIVSLLFMVINQVVAMTADENLPILLTSDSAVCQREKEVNVCAYINNAHLSQGTTNLHAEKITVYKKAVGNISKIVASGRYSNYSTVLENNKQVNATANFITIYPRQNKMILQGHGEIVVDKDIYRGPNIEYVFK